MKGLWCHTQRCLSSCCHLQQGMEARPHYLAFLPFCVMWELLKGSQDANLRAVGVQVLFSGEWVCGSRRVMLWWWHADRTCPLSFSLYRHHTNPVGTEWRWKMDPAEKIIQEAVENHRNMIRQFRGEGFLERCCLVPSVDLFCCLETNNSRLKGLFHY